MEEGRLTGEIQDPEANQVADICLSKLTSDTAIHCTALAATGI